MDIQVIKLRRFQNMFVFIACYNNYILHAPTILVKSDQTILTKLWATFCFSILGKNMAQRWWKHNTYGLIRTQPV